jgi:hypothetical protein
MLVWTESCQRLRTDALVQQRYGVGSWLSTGGRNNGPRITTGHYAQPGVYPQHPAPSGSVFLCGLRLCGLPNVYSGWVVPRWSGVSQVGIEIAADGALKVVGAATLATAPGAYDGNVRYLSVEIGIDPTAGYTRVWLDGVAVAALSLDNINTQLEGGGLWDSFYAGGTWGPSFCDLMVADGTDPSGAGHDRHEIWMDARVDYLPANGNGYSSQFVGQDANSVDNYQQVDETTPDDDTTYVESPSAAVDGYTKSACPGADAAILGACVFARARKTDAGVAVVRVGLRSGSTNGMSDEQALSTDYADVYQHVGHDPDNGALTQTSLDACEIVIEKV